MMNFMLFLRRQVEASKGVLLILATVVLVYPPIIAADYGFSDDFSWMQHSESVSTLWTDAKGELSDDGRYLEPAWTLGLLGNARGIGDLRYIRFVTVIAIFLSACVFYKLLREYLFEDEMEASLVAALFAINPSFLLISAWAQVGSVAYATFLGLLSIYALLHAESSHSHNARQQSAATRIDFLAWNPGRLILASFLLLAALSLYQPSAMIYWTGVGIWVLGRFGASRQNWFKLVTFTAIFFLICAIYFLIGKVFSHHNSRFGSGISLSFIRRAGWFVVHPLRTTLSYPLFHPVWAWSVVAGAFLFFGLWLFCRQRQVTLWILPLVGIFLPLTVLPTIIAYVHYDVFRTRPAIYGLIIILWCVALKAVVHKFRLPFLLRHLLVPALVLLAAFGSYGLQRYLIIPQVREESALKIKLEEYARDNPNLDRPIVIFPPPKDERFAGFRGGDEWGIADLSQTWVPETLTRQILSGLVDPQVFEAHPVKVIGIYGNETIPPDAFQIDLRELRAPR